MNFNIYSKYKSISTPAKASLWFFICGILQNGLSMISLPIFTNLLTTEQYGLNSTFFAWNDFIIILCTLKLSYGAFDKGMINFEVNRDKMISSMLGLTTTISLIILLGVTIFHNIIESIIGLSYVLLLSLVICQIFAPALSFWMAKNRYEYKYKVFTIVTIVVSIVCMIVNILSVIYIDYDKGLIRILSYQIIWTIIYIFFYIYIFMKGKCYYNKEVWIFALKFNLPLVPYFLSTLLLDKVTRIMIGYFDNNISVALYSVSYNIGRLLILLTAAIDASFTPWFYNKIKNKDLTGIRIIIINILLGFMLVNIIFILFAPELISLFATREYLSAIYIIPPVATSYFFVMIYGLISKIEFYYEKTKIIAKITIIAAALNVILNYLLIPLYGYLITGYITLICYIIMAFFHVIMANIIAREEKINEYFPWKIFIYLSIIMVSLTIIINQIYDLIFVRYFIILIMIVCLFIYKDKFIKIYKEMKGYNI